MLLIMELICWIRKHGDTEIISWNFCVLFCKLQCFYFFVEKAQKESVSSQKCSLLRNRGLNPTMTFSFTYPMLYVKHLNFNLCWHWHFWNLNRKILWNFYTLLVLFLKKKKKKLANFKLVIDVWLLGIWA